MSSRPFARSASFGSDTLPSDLVAAVSTNILGKTAVIKLAVTTLLAGGHLLIEDVPGLGKTRLARSLADAIGGEERRVQGAPDLLPGDLTGTSMWHPERLEFTFVPGPLFANVVLVDELNRIPPRTQAALLEAMEEGAVSVDGVTHRLPTPNLVIATQNPVEQHGTFPLPEAQLDRFMASTSMGYPSQLDERNVILANVQGQTRTIVDAVTDPVRFVEFRETVTDVYVSEPIIEYIVRLVSSTRTAAGVELGASPRAGIHLARMAQAAAALDGREHVLPDDVKQLTSAVLTHRILTDTNHTANDVVAAIIAKTPVHQG